MSGQKSPHPNLPLALFLLRLGVFIVFLMWTLDKFLNPEHTASVFEQFYFTPGLSSGFSYVLGLLQALVVIAFLVGYRKRLSYGLVFLMHFVSTVSSYQRYFDPWTAPNLLFFAAWPMLAAIAALYLLRDQDTLFTLGSTRR